MINILIGAAAIAVIIVVMTILSHGIAEHTFNNHQDD